MTHDETLAAIEEIAPGAIIRKAGPYWDVTLPGGKHTGGSEDGIGLARRLVEIRDRPAPVFEDAKPDGLQTALKRAREAREALEARVTPEPAPVEDAVPDEPPESIADLFVGDRPLGPQAKALHDLWRNLGNQIQRGMASPEETRKHERLSSEIRFITKHAFEGI